MRKSTIVYSISFIIVALVAVSSHAQDVSLLKIIAKWQYPNSKTSGAQMSDGTTVDAEGKRTVQSIICRAEMKTNDSVKKVLEYYKTKLNRKKVHGEKEVDGGMSIVIHDDSRGRPFQMHTILVNAKESSTTLIITRSRAEDKTVIDWKQYRRLD